MSRGGGEPRGGGERRRRASGRRRRARAAAAARGGGRAGGLADPAYHRGEMVTAERSDRRSTAPTRRSASAGPADGTRLAYAVHGSGPPLVVASCWLSHLQHDWQSPVWRHFLDDLGAIATVVRYDERGFGMSDWDVDDFSLAARLGDLEAVVDAAGLDRFALLGHVRRLGGPALAYAVAHPERLTRLVLYGTVCGDPGRPATATARPRRRRTGA